MAETIVRQAHTNRAKVYCPNHPAANTQGHVYRYRLVMEAKLGRYLRADEIVHHINGNPLDDREENLEVLTRANHAQEHSLAKQGKWSRKFDSCRGCNRTDRAHHSLGLCKVCYPKRADQSRPGDGAPISYGPVADAVLDSYDDIASN